MDKNINTLITHGKLVTLDENDHILEDGALAISGSQIADLGSTDALVAQYGSQVEETIDAKGKIVMPGLVNAHTHAGMTLFRGYAEDMLLEAWLEKLWEKEAVYVRPDTVRLGTKLAMAEMIRAGTTTALDMYWYPHDCAEAAIEAGFRLVTGPIAVSFPGPDKFDLDQRLSLGREYLEQYNGHPLIVSCVQPHATYTVPPEDLKKFHSLAEEFDVLVHTHASETKAELTKVQDLYGQSPIQHLESLDMLTPQTILAHCVHINDEEIKLLAENGTAVAHVPISNLKLGSGIAPLIKMIKAGVKVSLGTDGTSSSNDLNLWMSMRFAALLPKGLTHDASIITASEVIRMATIGGARALGIEALVGSLEVGKRADIIFIDLDNPHVTPMYDVYPHLVYTVGRDDVSTVIINGQVVMKNRQLVTLDEDGIIGRVKDLSEEIKSSS
jgi:5-methylthioadenosine/S-adenosylhomocysteine deaminase